MNDNIYKTKFKKSDHQSNIDENRVAANITEWHMISKLVFLIINIPKFMNVRNLFNVHISSPF